MSFHGFSEGEKAKLSAFPLWYTRVLHHSRFEDITYKELSLIEGRPRRLAELFAAEGIDRISFDDLQRTIKAIDAYLQHGHFEEQVARDLQRSLAGQALRLYSVLPDLMDGGDVERNFLDGTPVVMVAFENAVKLFDVCRIVEKVPDGKDRAVLRLQLWANRRNDPDMDPDPEKIPEYS